MERYTEMITQKTTEGTYQFQTAATITARYHDGRTRRAVQVVVRNETRGGEYTVLIPVDGGAASCSCLGWKHHTSCRRSGCRHISMSLAHLLAEATPAPAAVSPTIIGQIEEAPMTTRYYLLHVSGAFYGQDAGGAFCSTRNPEEVYYWPTREQAEANRKWQEEHGFSYTVEEEQINLPDESREIEDRQQARLAKAEADRCLWD
jgi:hypothetical protein